jgi:hypothetical protein
MNAHRFLPFWFLASFIGVVPLFAAEMSSETVDAIRAEVAGPFDQFPTFGESTAEAFVLEYGSDAVPILIEIVQDESLAPRNKVKAAFYLGKSEDPSAVQPLIALFEDSIAREIPSERRRMMGFCLDALGFTNHREAFVFLERCAGKRYWEELPVQPTVPEDDKDEQETQRYFREWALRGLGVASNPQALDTLTRLRDGAASDLVDKVDTWLREAQKRVELAKAVDLTGPPDDPTAFWEHQAFAPSPTLEQDIVGRYSGEVYQSYMGGAEPFDPLTGVVVEFSDDGTVRTNLEELVLAKERGRSRIEGISGDWFEGQYRVLGPTQLLIAPGKDVTTFAVRYREGTLAFCHLRMRASFLLRKDGAPARSAPDFKPADFSGVYEGVAFVAEEGAQEIAKVDGIRISFAENGFLTTNFGSNYGKIFGGFNTANGRYHLDHAGLLASTMNISGGDFGGAEASAFFDWNWRDGQLHLNNFHMAYYGAALTLAPKGHPIHLNQEPVIRQLTQAPYMGTAYRAKLDGTIEEIPGIKIAFSADGTYQSNFPDKLRGPDDQYYPEAKGPFVVVTDRQLYMAQRWDNGLTNAGITDFLIEGDKLWFTSLTFDAYFFLTREGSAPSP